MGLRYTYATDRSLLRLYPQPDILPIMNTPTALRVAIVVPARRAA